jgi:hypothetical protein
VHWGLTEAPTALMGWPLIVVSEPSVKIGLQLFDGPIDLFAERDPVELVEQRAVETLADSRGPSASRSAAEGRKRYPPFHCGRADGDGTMARTGKL